MMNVGDGVFTLFALLPIVIYLAVFIFGIYFVLKVIKFMDTKIKIDQEKNKKIDQLIKVIEQQKNQ